MGHIIVGTAGHIDHGKSLLVKALTGTDPDRLPEEQDRNITIDIGFAFLDDVAAIIDVPGHERFIRNMVAGAATVDYAILVIAADDGVMPQTREHLEILRLLEIERGLIVITKADLVEEEWLELIQDQIEELIADTFLQGEKRFIVDSVSGRGIANLREYLLAELTKLQGRKDRGFFKLPIDRVFQMRGFGTIVTGTVVSGQVRVDDRLELLPQRKEVRVRGLQTHGTTQTILTSGQRAAINVGRVDKQELTRGNVLVAPGHMVPTKHWRATVTLLRNISPLKNRQRVRVHIGTQEVISRVVPRITEPPLVDFYLEAPAAASRLDKFVIRSYSPMTTIGGGTIVEMNPPRVRKRKRGTELETSATLSQTDGQDFIYNYLNLRALFGATLSELIQIIGYGRQKATPWLDDLLAKGKIVLVGERYLSVSSLQKHREKILRTLSEFHRKQPELPGMERAELRQAALPDIPENLFSFIMKALLGDNKIKIEGSLVNIIGHTAVLSSAREALAGKLLNLISTAVFRPPSVSDMSVQLGAPIGEIGKVLTLLSKQKRLVRLEPELFFHPDNFSEAIRKLQKEIEVRGAVTVGDVSTLLNSTRKYIVPFLEYVDKIGITRRDGDQRIAGSSQENKNA